MTKNISNNYSPLNHSYHSIKPKENNTKKILLIIFIIVTIVSTICTVLMGMNIIGLGLGMGIIVAFAGLLILGKIALCIKPSSKKKIFNPENQNVATKRSTKLNLDPVKDSPIILDILDPKISNTPPAQESSLASYEEIPDFFLKSLLIHIRDNSTPPSLNTSYSEVLVLCEKKALSTHLLDKTAVSLKNDIQENINFFTKKLEELQQAFQKDQYTIDQSRSVLEEGENNLDYMKKGIDSSHRSTIYWSADESFRLIEKFEEFEIKIKTNKQTINQLKSLIYKEKERLTKS